MSTTIVDDLKGLAARMQEVIEKAGEPHTDEAAVAAAVAEAVAAAVAEAVAAALTKLKSEASESRCILEEQVAYLSSKSDRQTEMIKQLIDKIEREMSHHSRYNALKAALRDLLPREKGLEMRDEVHAKWEPICQSMVAKLEGETEKWDEEEEVILKIHKAKVKKIADCHEAERRNNGARASLKRPFDKDAQRSKAPAASGKAVAASGKAVAASGKAVAASGKAVAASGKAVAASGKAPAASGKAPAASGKAPAASGKAPAASGKAPAASGKAPAAPKKSKAKVDPLAPKKPTNARTICMQDMSDEWNAESKRYSAQGTPGQAPFGTVFEWFKPKWDAMGEQERLPFVKKLAAAKKQYALDLAAY